jgi:hypothetical protein
MDSLVINVLTRTSGRKNYFKKCCFSIDMQTYKNINHIVCTDDINSLEYIAGCGRTPIYVEPIEKDARVENKIISAPYNLYLNILYNHVNEGLVVILDDDDEFSINKSLEIIAEIFNNQDNPSENILFWQVGFEKGKIIPADFKGGFLYPTNVSAIGFAFHSKYLFAAQWDAFKESDFRVAHKLSLVIPNKKALKMVLTQTQRKDAMGGFGERDDIVV